MRNTKTHIKILENNDKENGKRVEEMIDKICSLMTDFWDELENKDSESERRDIVRD